MFSNVDVEQANSSHIFHDKGKTVRATMVCCEAASHYSLVCRTDILSEKNLVSWKITNVVE